MVSTFCHNPLRKAKLPTGHSAFRPALFAKRAGRGSPPVHPPKFSFRKLWRARIWKGGGLPAEALSSLSDSINNSRKNFAALA